MFFEVLRVKGLFRVIAVIVPVILDSFLLQFRVAIFLLLYILIYLLLNFLLKLRLYLVFLARIALVASFAITVFLLIQVISDFEVELFAASAFDVVVKTGFETTINVSILLCSIFDLHALSFFFAVFLACFIIAVMIIFELD